MKLMKKLIIVLIIFILLFIIFRKRNNFAEYEKLHQDLYNLNLPLKLNIPILYINLDKDLDRKNFMKNQFMKNNLNAVRIKGIYGKEYNLDRDILKDSGEEFINEYKNISKSELGCLLSHIRAIKYARDNNYEKVLILEDDISMNILKLINFDKIISYVPKEYEILQLHHLSKDFKNEYSKNHSYSCGAYIINKKGMERLLNLVYKDNKIIIKNHKNIYGVADHYIYKLLNYYKFGIPLFYNYNNLTNMNSTIHTSHTDSHIFYNHKILKFWFKNILNI